MPNCRDTNCESVAERKPSHKQQTQPLNDDFLDTDISDLPLPDLPVKKSNKDSREERGHSEAVTSAEETFVTPPSLSLLRTPTKAKKLHTRNSSLPRSFRQRNEARAGYLLRKQQRMKTNSAEDLLSLERRTMSSSRMHYGSQVDKPRYLFGETSTLHSTLANSRGPRHCLSDDKHAAATGPDFDDEIFLNKSGWVQVKQRSSHDGRSSRFDGNNSSSNSKLEDLMLRNEARKTVAMQNFYQKGYLPVARNGLGKIDSPPPMTPIISPPPAFQDGSAAAAAASGGVSAKPRNGKQPVGARVHLTVSDTDYQHLPHNHHQRSAISNNGNGSSNNSNKSTSGKGNNTANNAGTKGMVFSKSFEYDNRKMNTDYSEVFSKSFEYDLSTSSAAGGPAQPIPTPPTKLQQSASLLQIQRERMPAFSKLTGNSPNYLTKKEWGPYRPSLLSQQPNAHSSASATGSTGVLTSRSRDTSPNQAKLPAPQTYPAQPPVVVLATGRKVYAVPSRVSEKKKADRYESFDEQVGRSRRAQFSRLRNESSNSSSSRSVDVAMVNRRLNSCDSGARSGKISTSDWLVSISWSTLICF